MNIYASFLYLSAELKIITRGHLLASKKLAETLRCFSNNDKQTKLRGGYFLNENIRNSIISEAFKAQNETVAINLPPLTPQDISANCNNFRKYSIFQKIFK